MRAVGAVGRVMTCGRILLEQTYAVPTCLYFDTVYIKLNNGTD